MVRSDQEINVIYVKWFGKINKKGELDMCSAYKVKVKTTNAMRDTTCDNWDSDASMQDINYYDCEDGTLYVITDDPKSIYDKFGKDTILSVERVGIGYCLVGKEVKDELS